MKSIEKKENILTDKKLMVLLALLCCALWGSAFPAIKILYSMVEPQGTFDKLFQAGLRFTLSGLMIIGFLFVRSDKKNNILPKKEHLPFIIKIALLQTFLAYSFYYVGLYNVSGVKASLLVSTGSFMVVILSHFFIKNDRITKTKILGLILGFMGIFAINFSGLSANLFNFSFWGDGILIIQCLFGAIAVILIKKKPASLGVLQLNGFQLLFGGILLLIVSLLGIESLPQFDWSSVLIVIYMALLSAVAFSLWFLLLKYNNPSKLAIIKFTVPLFGALLSALLVPDESISIEHIFAIVLISLGIMIVNYNNYQKNQKQ